ncbi:ribonuclease H-like domain-containing protein [Xylaria bambusicola]|uniref:ribonuclease H-like domain-containing protein n=1 Tax=Xylaria bambusicola TaxID=326684 RepID=UPI0020089DB1|nr:ribonuclease H-like domain-containing protein [Xylaria bambusicola]KAI0521294.1 ribonuclease H-like domain-containing protein [Xylaria bambusicola]
MASSFYPEKYLGRALRSGETIEVPMTLTRLRDDEFNSLIVAVDGACRNNGQPDARAALGVFFGDDSSWNKSDRLPHRDASSQRAELCAALRALKTIGNLVAHEWKHHITSGRTLDRVIVKSDSAYLVNGITEWIFKWLDNGFTNARSQPVQNQDLFKELLHVINRLGREKRIRVLFWHVMREQNADADRLANAALDAFQAPVWDYRNPPTQQEAETYASERVWRWHQRLGHIPLEELQETLSVTRGIDVTHEQIQTEIDKGVRCQRCRSLERLSGSYVF